MRVLAFVILAAFALWLFAWALAIHALAQDDAPSYVFTILKHETFDFRGIQFYELRSSEGSATLSMDADCALSKTLSALQGQRVRMTLEPTTRTFKRIER